MNDLELLSVILGLRISEALMILVLGWIIGSIPIYFVAKHFNKNVSFEKILGFIILLGILYFIIIVKFNYFFYIIGIIIDFIIFLNFIIFLSIYKIVFNASWRVAFGMSIVSIVAIMIEIILISVVFAVADGISTVYIPVGKMEIEIIGIIMWFMLGLILSVIFIYLIAKLLNINISFLENSTVNLFPGTLSFIIIIISVLLYILAENNVGFFIGAGIIFIVVSISYKYILNISWRKAILMSIIFSVLWPIIGLKILPYYIHIYYMACC
ncbi:hypothetical protein Nps_00850 [Candidatus Nanopusillus acidilobi]|nr:hypothetical protein Nps_00850 [Candidatus Nanopusillus acidilobi]